MCKTAETGVCAPFTAIVRILPDPTNGIVPTMSTLEIVMGLWDEDKITLLPGWGFTLHLAFGVARFSREVQVRWCTFKGMSTIHISSNDGKDPQASLPLGVGDHEATVTRSALWHIKR